MRRRASQRIFPSKGNTKLLGDQEVERRQDFKQESAAVKFAASCGGNPSSLSERKWAGWGTGGTRSRMMIGCGATREVGSSSSGQHLHTRLHVDWRVSLQLTISYCALLPILHYSSIPPLLRRATPPSPRLVLVPPFARSPYSPSRLLHRIILVYSQPHPTLTDRPKGAVLIA